MDHPFIEHIDAYLEGNLSREALEKLALEAGVEDLDSEINWLRNARLAIEAEGLKEKLSALYGTMSAGKPEDATEDGKGGGGIVRALGRNYLPLSIAASVVLIVALVFALRPSEHQKLYAQFEYIDPGIPILMSETDRYELYNALTFYSEENFPAAIQRFESLNYEDATFRDTVEFFLGASYLYTGRTEPARELLVSVSADSNSAFAERAEWLHVLTLLKEGELDGVRTSLERIISDPGHPFYRKSLALQGKLDS